VPWQQSRLRATRCVQTGAQPGDPGEWLSPSHQLSWDHIYYPASSCGPSNKGKTWISWSDFNRAPKLTRGSMLVLWERLRDLGLFSLEKRWILGCNSSPLYLPGGRQEGRARRLTEVRGGRVRVNSHKWKWEGHSGCNKTTLDSLLLRYC